MKFALNPLFFIIIFIAGCSTKSLTEKPHENILTKLKAAPTEKVFEYPAISSNEMITTYNGFAVLFNFEKKIPIWSAYSLTPEQLNAKNVKRINKFKSDPSIDANLTPQDYTKSGYDRGHMTPADDMRWSLASMQDTFYMTNMSPQEHKLNAGIWRKLESNVKKWVSGYDKIYVVTGPNLQKNCLKFIAKKICVPAEFYKVILRKKGSKTEAIAFLIPHHFDKSKNLQSYAMSVSEVEKIVGINFFPQLTEQESKNIEGSEDFSLWF